MIDPDYQRAREHAVKHGPLPCSATPTADLLDGDYDTTAYVQSPLAAIKLGRELALEGAVAVAERRVNLCYQRVDGRGINDAKATVAEIKALISNPEIVIEPKGSTAEHWSVEQLKRIVIEAMVINEQDRGKKMSTIARRAADKIIHLLRPLDQHRNMAS